MTQQLSPSPLKNSLGFPFSFPRRLGAHGQRLCPRPRLAALSCTAPARAQIHGGTLPSRKGQGRDQHHVHLHWPSHRSSMRLFQNTHLKLLQAKKAEEGSCDPGLRVFNEAKPGFLATFPTTLEHELSGPSRVLQRPLPCQVVLQHSPHARLGPYLRPGLGLASLKTGP